jgi:hypothetical protein
MQFICCLGVENVAGFQRFAHEPRSPKCFADREVTVENAIIGAGIAGLYCGYLFDLKKDDFLIAEETKHLGGRIWTTKILKNGREVGDGEKAPEQEEFFAEFGPMRLELDLQERLEALLDDLGFTSADHEPFPPYESPISKHDPQYELRGEEIEQSTPFDLLILAVLRIFGRIHIAENATPPLLEPLIFLARFVNL